MPTTWYCLTKKRSQLCDAKRVQRNSCQIRLKFKYQVSYILKSKQSQKWRKIKGCRWIPLTTNKPLFKATVFVFVDNKIYPLVWEKDIKYTWLQDTRCSVHKQVEEASHHHVGFLILNFYNLQTICKHTFDVWCFCILFRHA